MESNLLTIFTTGGQTPFYFLKLIYLIPKAANWNVHLVQDGNLITGQNPASSNKVADQLYESLK
ncbi:hypothetical protein GIHI108528_12260 [Gillisia hiemivivida]